MAQVTARRRLGRTAVEVTELGFGGASIGELFVRVSERDAAATIAAAWDAGIRYFDTAPWYGRGLSELRTGAGLRDHPRDDYAFSTKVGRWLRPSVVDDFDGSPWLGGSRNDITFDYTYDGIGACSGDSTQQNCPVTSAPSSLVSRNTRSTAFSGGSPPVSSTQAAHSR